jgi:predicted nuclease of predicted toxin-antitoxin system
LLPRPENLVLHFLLDEGVPNAVGSVIIRRGHSVVFGNRSLPRGSADQLVAAAALKDGAILVAADHDMKGIAKAQGVGNERFKLLSLVKLSCRKPEAAERIEQAMSLIEHEWQHSEGSDGRRVFIEILTAVVRVVRPVPNPQGPRDDVW